MKKSKAKICYRCGGVDGPLNCYMCRELVAAPPRIKKNKDKTVELSLERERFLAELWVKAWKFQMPRIENSPIYDAVMARFGPWINDHGQRLSLNTEVRELLRI